MKLIQILNEAKEDFVVRAVKRLKLKWKKEIDKRGEHSIVTTITNDGVTAAFMIYYDPDDDTDVGWAMGKVKKNGKYNWGGSGTDDISETIKILKGWLKDS